VILGAYTLIEQSITAHWVVKEAVYGKFMK